MTVGMFIQAHEKGIVLRVKVSPNAKKTEIGDVVSDRLTVRLSSPPVEGKANKELVKFLAKKLRVAPSNIEILQGKTSREKVLLIHGTDQKVVEQSLNIMEEMLPIKEDAGTGRRKTE
jgi:uncharacterized protein